MQRKAKFSKGKTVLQLKVKGKGWRSGTIPVPELIKICEEAQRAVNRQAEALSGKTKTQHPGPVADKIQHECTLELIGVRKGSTTLQFAIALPHLPAKSQFEMNFQEENEAFGEKVISALAGTIKALGNGKPPGPVDEGVLKSVYALTGVVGKHVDELNWIAPKIGAFKRIAAPLNHLVRERTAERLSVARRSIATVDGILRMGDFKPSDRKCRIDPPLGPSVNCTFDEAEEPGVFALMKKAVRATGEAIFQPLSDKIDVLQISTIEELPSIKLGEGDFYKADSIADLARQQGVKASKDGRSLEGAFPVDENIDDFLAVIYEARK